MSTQEKVSVLLIFLLLTASCRNPHEAEAAKIASIPDSSISDQQKVPLLVFGIPSDSFNLIPGHIKPNGFLSQILLDHGVTLQEIDQVIKNSSTVFDVRKIKSGNNYTLFCDTDSLARARYLVYEHDPTTCYIFSFRDSLNITPFRKEIRKVIKYSSGTIETSLWDAMINGGMHPSLAVELSEIFAWTVDFFGLQKGDSFKVIYEESFIDDKSLGTGRIFGAQFTWSGKTITAVPFIQDGKRVFSRTMVTASAKPFLKRLCHFHGLLQGSLQAGCIRFSGYADLITVSIMLHR